MSRLVIKLFCEDSGHEAFARALIRRLASEAGQPTPEIEPRSVRGGHGKAISELVAWQRWVRRGVESPGDALVVCVDGNGTGWATQRKTIEREVDRGLFATCIIACPDPHVEAWCAADPEALQRKLEVVLPPLPLRPGRDVYKRWLSDALDAAGHIVFDDPMDIAPELVPEMDLFKAGKAQPSLGALITDLQALFKRAASTP